MTEYDDDIFGGNQHDDDPEREEEGDEEGENELEEEDYDETAEEQIDHNRRKLLCALGATLFAALPIVSGVVTSCIDFAERMEARELNGLMDGKVDKQGRELYFYDDVTEQFLLRYAMRDTHKAFPERVKLKNGKPILSKAYKIVTEIPASERKIVHAVNCNGQEMYDMYYRPIELAKMAADKLKQADELLYNATEGSEHIMFTTSFRDNLFQYRLFKRKEETGRPRRVGPVGGSRHQLGLAVDVINWVEAEKWLVRSKFVGGMYGSGAGMRHDDAWHFSYDFRGYKKGKEKPQSRYNELVRDVVLNEEVKDSWMDDLPLVGDALKDAFYNSSEWVIIKKRYGGFLIHGEGTEAYNYGVGKIKELLGLI